MRTSAKLGLTALVAAFLLASVISTASARNLSVSEQSFRSTFASLEFRTSFTTVKCRVTLEGSFHTRTIAKVQNALVGALTRAIVAHPCTNGEAWADNGTETEPLGTAPNRLPFHVQYESFRGSLPTIEAVNLLTSRASFVIQATVLGLTCRGRYGNATDSIRTLATREVGGGITSLRPSGTATLVEELGPNRVCPSTGGFEGTGTAVSLSTGTNLTVTLI